MTFSRRTFLIGAGSGLSILVLTACGTPTPVPTSTPKPTTTPKIALPEPDAVMRSSWSTDPFARGSHSFLAVGSAPEHREALRRPLLDRVFFAGEATSSENPGTVIGAHASGARAADEIAAVSDPGERIAVIGAGAAGAEAARLLQLRGYDVVVVEARDRIGGRIHTIDDDWPVPAELGAWRLGETSGAELIAILSRLGIGTSAIAQSAFRSADAETDENPIGPTAIDTAIAWAADQQRDVTIEVALEESGAAKEATRNEIETDAGDLDGGALLTTHLAAIAATYGAGASALSSWYGLGQPLEPQVAVTGAFAGLIADSLKGIEVSLSTVVVGISHDDERVSLRLGTGESLTVDRAIVTVPLGVLQGEGIEFDPLLPFAQRAAIGSLGMGTVDTIWLSFDEPFWRSDAVAWQLVGTDAQITSWFNLEPLTGEAILVGIVGGDAAIALAELDDDEVAEIALASLVPFADDLPD